MAQRKPLSVERVVAAAAAVADEQGLAAVSMRNVAKQLGVEAMSLYHHVKNKDALLGELTEWIFRQVATPPSAGTWRTRLTAYAESLRAVLDTHPWALGLVNSRKAPGPEKLRLVDAPLGILFDAAFSVGDAVHTLSAVDAYVFGFVITNRNLPFDTTAAVEKSDFSPELAGALAGYPNLARVAEELMSSSSFHYVDEFRYGLDTLLDEVERRSLS